MKLEFSLWQVFGIWYFGVICGVVGFVGVLWMGGYIH